MQRIIRHILLTLALAATITAAAQTDAQFSQYYEIKNFYNPGAIGNTDNIQLRGGARLQWIGIENAPQSFIATGDMPFKFLGKRFGVGVVAEGEKMGLYNSLNVSGQAAYKFRKFGGEFSVGVNVGMYDQRFRGSEVYIPDDDDYHHSSDDAIPTRDIHGTALDLGAGVYYSRPSFWIGASATHLTSPVITMKSEGTDASQESVNYEFQAPMTLYLMGGGNIPVKDTLFELMPSVMVKSDFTLWSAEATMRARYNKFMIFGLGYRWGDAVYATIGVELKDFFLGYSYDYATSAIAKASSGSHEVFLGYSMKLDLSDKNKNKHKSIRIM